MTDPAVTRSLGTLVQAARARVAADNLRGVTTSSSVRLLAQIEGTHEAIAVGSEIDSPNQNSAKNDARLVPNPKGRGLRVPFTKSRAAEPKDTFDVVIEERSVPKNRVRVVEIKGLQGHYSDIAAKSPKSLEGIDLVHLKGGETIGVKFVIDGGTHVVDSRLKNQ